MAEGNIAPKDPYKLAYIIFYWLGIGSLLPWNFFITVPTYWEFKYRNITEYPDLISFEERNKDYERSDLQKFWPSYLSIASMIPNVLFLKLNAIFGHRFRSQPRLLTAMIIIIGLFIFSDAMAKVNTDAWQKQFMSLTLFTVVIINIMVAVFQGGLSGLAGKFPPIYMGAVVQGQALGGIFAATSNVVMLSCGADDVSAAFYNFLIAVIFLISALIAFIVLTRTEFFQYYADEGNPNETTVVNEDDTSNEKLIGDNGGEIVIPEQTTTLAIIGRIWVWILAVFLTFLVCLAVFPSITAQVVSMGSGKDGTEWNNKYFIPVGCFLLFNIGDFVGRMLASVIQWPKANHMGSIIILGLALARVAFIPLFLFCNVAPSNRSVTDVHFHSDAVYLILMVLFSVSSGYIGSIVLMYGPKMMNSSEEQGRAASLLVFFLVLGLCLGSATSYGAVTLL